MEALDYSIFPERTVVYTDFWTRFAAAFIDGLIIIVLSFVVKLILSDVALSENYSLRLFSNIILGWIYNALQESGPKMATVGKRAMEIKVTGQDGERITFGQATGRHFGKIISTLILFIGYFMMLWDERRQTLHDKMAGTLVVLR